MSWKSSFSQPVCWSAILFLIACPFAAKAAVGSGPFTSGNGTVTISNVNNVAVIDWVSMGDGSFVQAYSFQAGPAVGGGRLDGNVPYSNGAAAHHHEVAIPPGGLVRAYTYLGASAQFYYDAISVNWIEPPEDPCEDKSKVCMTIDYPALPTPPFQMRITYSRTVDGADPDLQDWPFTPHSQGGRVYFELPAATYGDPSPCKSITWEFLEVAFKETSESEWVAIEGYENFHHVEVATCAGDYDYESPPDPTNTATNTGTPGPTHPNPREEIDAIWTGAETDQTPHAKQDQVLWEAGEDNDDRRNARVTGAIGDAANEIAGAVGLGTTGTIGAIDALGDKTDGVREGVEDGNELLGEIRDGINRISPVLGTDAAELDTAEGRLNTQKGTGESHEGWAGTEYEVGEQEINAITPITFQFSFLDIEMDINPAEWISENWGSTAILRTLGIAFIIVGFVIGMQDKIDRYIVGLTMAPQSQVNNGPENVLPGVAQGKVALTAGVIVTITVAGCVALFAVIDTGIAMFGGTGGIAGAIGTNFLGPFGQIMAFVDTFFPIGLAMTAWLVQVSLGFVIPPLYVGSCAVIRFLNV